MNQGGGPDHQIEGGMHSARLGGLGLETGIAFGAHLIEGKHIEAVFEYSLPGGSECGLLRMIHAVEHLQMTDHRDAVPGFRMFPPSAHHRFQGTFLDGLGIHGGVEENEAL